MFLIHIENLEDGANLIGALVKLQLGEILGASPITICLRHFPDREGRVLDGIQFQARGLRLNRVVVGLGSHEARRWAPHG